MIIIPAIDIIDGKCVRLTKGDYDIKKIYSDNPLDIAKGFEDAGLTRLHLVDLDGAKSKHIVNHKVLERISSNTRLIIDFGGGIKSKNDLSIAFECGAEMVTIGSTAVTSPELMTEWIETFGSEKIILGADVRDNFISVNGWKEDSRLMLMDFLSEYTKKGIEKVLCTDINRDGMLQGPAVELYKSILAGYPSMHLIASGGVSCVNDLTELKTAGLPAAIVGKAFYEGKISLKQLSELNN
jgi:phosphoribosylformimino-5-aminoimidazole carboxamide ribotide isomerase